MIATQEAMAIMTDHVNINDLEAHPVIKPTKMSSFLYPTVNQSPWCKIAIAHTSRDSHLYSSHCALIYSERALDWRSGERVLDPVMLLTHVILKNHLPSQKLRLFNFKILTIPTSQDPQEN